MSAGWLFLLNATALIALVLWVLVRALRGSSADDAASDRRQQANAAVYREQWAELEREHASGKLDADEWARARAELQSRLLQDVDGLSPGADGSWRANCLRSTQAGLALGVPLISLAGYLLLGQPAALDPQVRLSGLPQAEVTAEKLELLGRELRSRTENNPGQPEDWLMLSRVERALGRFEPAQQAMAQALKLSYNPDWAIEQAELLASRDQGSFQGEPWQIIESVLKADPAHLGALLLAGSASYAEGKFAQALKHWENASALVPVQSPERQPLDAALGEVRAKLGLPDPQAERIAASAIHGRVSLAGEALKSVRPQDTVFIYATLPEARMPLAIVRIQASELPYDFTLDDHQAMNPQARLSMAEQLVIRARVSKSGQAQAQNDDWGVELPGVKPGARGLNLVIQEHLK